jgi:outer membrane protein
MQKILIGILASVSLAMPAWAELKIAVFDTNAVLAGNNAAKRAASAMESRVSAAQSRIQQLEQPLLTKQQQLREQTAVMTPEKAREAQAAFAKELSAFRQQAQTIQSSLETENQKQRGRIAEGVRTAVAQLAQEKQLDLVLPKGMIFFSSNAVPDVTAEVLSRANAILDK